MIGHFYTPIVSVKMKNLFSENTLAKIALQHAALTYIQGSISKRDLNDIKIQHGIAKIEKNNGKSDSPDPMTLPILARPIIHLLKSMLYPSSSSKSLRG